jgi:hypothetical protein
MHRKVKQIQYFISIGTICIETCLAQRKMLESVTLYEVAPQAPLQRLSSLVKTSYDDGAT